MMFASRSLVTVLLVVATLVVMLGEAFGAVRSKPAQD